jgi:hypothetical protein
MAGGVTAQRSTRCPNCGGIVSIPARSRTFTLDVILEHHLAACPAPAPTPKGPR